MALVDCIECNAKISDKAAACPKCGCPEPFKSKVEHGDCPECGETILIAETTCPNCGYPEPFNSNNLSGEYKETNFLFELGEDSTNSKHSRLLDADEGIEMEFKKENINQIQYSWNIIDGWYYPEYSMHYKFPNVFLGMRSEKFKKLNPSIGITKVKNDRGFIDIAEQIVDIPFIKGHHKMSTTFESDKIVQISHQMTNLPEDYLLYKHNKHELFGGRLFSKTLNIIPNKFLIMKREYHLMNKITGSIKSVSDEDIPILRPLSDVTTIFIETQYDLFSCSIAISFNSTNDVSVEHITWVFSEGNKN